MAQFNLEDYEPVQNRIAKFYEKYPDGRIITDMERYEDKLIIFKAILYKSGEDFSNGIVLSTGWAQETEGKGFVNQNSALENCETSSIGRALANIGLHGDKRPSREEIQKAQRGNDGNGKKSDKEIDQLKSEEEIKTHKNNLKQMGQRGEINVTKAELNEIAKAYDDRSFELSGLAS